MATLGLGLVGAALGGSSAAFGTFAGFVGLTGASLGFTLGSALGSYLTRPKAPDIRHDGPRLGDLNIQSSAYGVSIPTVYGASRLAGNLFWMSPTNEVENVEKYSSGGKGGGGGSTTVVTYEYFVSFAIGLCNNEIDAISRIWQDGKLIYDRSTANADDQGGVGGFIESAIVSDQTVDNFNFYLGTQDQQPDPAMESFEGVGNVPAYPGMSYIVFDNMQVERTAMNFTFEVIANGVKDYVIGDMDFDPKADFQPTDISLIWGDISNTLNYRVVPQSTSVLPGGNMQSQVVKVTYAGVEVQRYFETIHYPVSLGLGNGAMVMNGTIIGSDDLGFVQLPGGDIYVLQRSGDFDMTPYDYPLRDENGIALNNVSLCGFFHQGSIYSHSTKNGTGDTVYKHNGPFYGGADYFHTTPSNDDILALYVNDVGVYYIVEEAGVHKIRRLSHDLVQEMEWTGISTNAMDTLNASNEQEVIMTTADPNSVVFEVVRLNSDGSADLLVTDNKTSDSNVSAPIGDLVVYGSTWIGSHTNPGTLALSDVVSDICESAGLVAADYDVTDLAAIEVQGYTISQLMSARAALDALMAVYLFDIYESDYKIKFRVRGSAPSATIIQDELGAVSSNNDEQPLISRVEAQESELPRKVSVGYANLPLDYQISTQTIKRVVTNSNLDVSLRVPVILSNTEAKQLAEIILNTQWKERDGFSFNTGIKYAYLDPTDVIEVVTDDATYNIRVTKTDINDLTGIEGVLNDPTAYVSTAVGEDPDYDRQFMQYTGSTECCVMNLPALRDFDVAQPTYYAAMNGYYSGWIGGVLYGSEDGSSYTRVLDILNGSIIGRATNALTDDDSQTWDEEQTLNVKVFGELESVTPLDLLAGANALAYGDTGRYEVIQYLNATLQADGSYDLSGLLRGRKGTEWAMGSHAVNDKVVALSNASTRAVAYTPSKIDGESPFKCASIGQKQEQATDFTFTPNAENLMPYSPHHLHYSRSGNDIDVTWIRRDRASSPNFWEPPLSESSESYLVQYWDTGFTGLLREETVTSEADTYTSAEQTVDGIIPGVAVGVRVFQLSAVVTSKRYAQIIVPGV